MRSRRPRRMGGVRARASHAVRRRDRARRAGVGGAGRRRRGRRAPAGAARRSLRAVHRARRRRARARVGARLAELGHRRARAAGAARRGAPGRTSTRRASARSPCSATSCCPAGPLPLDGYDLVFFVAGEPRRSSLGARARGSSRRRCASCSTLKAGDVELDLLVASANDPGERYDGSLRVRHVAVTDGANGGTLDGEPYAAAPAGPIVDTYGAGDSFAAALAFALARGDDAQQRRRARRPCRRGRDRRRRPVRGAASVPGMSARVSWISLTPVKATMLHLVDEAELLRVRGARRPPLLLRHRARAALQQQGPRAAAARSRRLRRGRRRARRCALPTARCWTARSSAGEEVETSFHKLPRPARLVVGPWAEAVSELVGRAGPPRRAGAAGARPRSRRRGDAARDVVARPARAAARRRPRSIIAASG